MSSNIKACKACKADCCKNGPGVDLMEDDYQRLKDFIPDHLLQVQTHGIMGVTRLLLFHDGKCHFLTQYANCLIYDIRPELCRNFVCEKARKEV